MSKTARVSIGYRGDAGREFDPSNGTYFSLNREWAEWYARNQAKTRPGAPKILTAYLRLDKTLVDDDLVEAIAYLDPNAVNDLQQQGYDSVASRSGSEIFVFSATNIEVIAEEPLTPP
jgi:hypothetical protein